MPHHLHDHLHHVRQDDGAGVATVMSVVYVTAEPTFNGPVGGYVTGTQTPVPTSDPSSDMAAAADSAAATSLSPMPSVADGSTSSMGTSLSPMPSMSGAQATTLSPMPRVSSAAAMSSISSIPDSSFATPTSSLGSDSTSTAAPQEKDASQPQSTGMSSGAKAGLAFGIIIAITVIAGLAFFLWRRKKDNEEAQKKNADNEKNNPQNGGLQPRVSVKKANTATAPRLSLRPLTNLFGDSSAEDKQSAAGPNGGLVAPMAAHTRPRSTESKNSAWERGVSEKNAVDPFGDHAEVKPDSDNVDASAVPKPLNVSRPSSPSSNDSTSPTLSQGPDAGAAAGDSKAGLNVYRVQMDFIPSMDDELELRAGQLVRLLHEYDDGWCLCIRLDRSQQGVLPRTCISKQPVKPRPAPPPGAAARGPPGARPRPAGPPPAGGRMRSQSNAPQAGPFGTGQYRGQTTSPSQPQGRARAQSSASASSPPKDSPLESANSGSVPSRKPVPGQAM